MTIRITTRINPGRSIVGELLDGEGRLLYACEADDTNAGHDGLKSAIARACIERAIPGPAFASAWRKREQI